MASFSSVRTLLCVALALLVWFACDIHAQIEGRWEHHNLDWTTDPNMNLMATNAHLNALLFGWNFGAADREIAQHLNMRVDHTDDEWINGGAQVGSENERKHMLAGKILIPRIRGLGSHANRNIYRCPNESVAMEFHPWLTWNQTTGRMNFVPRDSSGGVFGFRHVAQNVTREGVGTDYQSLGLAATMTQPGVRVMVCDNIWPSDAVRRYNATDNTDGRYNTDTMFLSITLTVTNDPGGQAGDEILRIRLPYWRGSQAADFTPNAAQAGNNPPAGFIRFVNIPDANEAWQAVADPFPLVTEPNITIGRRKGPGIDLEPTPGGFTEELIITRAMLPPQNTEGTIEARFVCDLINVANPNPPHRNPRFFLNDQNTAADGNQNNDRISHLDIEVEYSGRVDLQLRNIRLETPAARDLFWRTRDVEIVGNAIGGGAILDYLAELDNRNTALQLNGAAGARVWRFYGKDEIIPCYWKSYRYLNRLLGGRLITEWGVWWPEAAYYSLRMVHFWQGNTFQPDPSVATYTIADGSASPSGATELQRQRRLGLTRGRNDFGRDPDLQVEGRALQVAPFTSFALPIPADSVDGLIHMDASGIQPRLELVMHERYWANRFMLFGADSISWLANVWNYSSMRFNGVAGAGNHSLEFVSNGRPKSCAEYRLQLWSPLILGAKGMLVYRGENSNFLSDPDALNPHLRPLPVPGADNRVNEPFEPCAFAGNIPFLAPNDLRATAPDLLIDNDVDNQCGDDWITAGDVTNADQWMRVGIQEVADTLEAAPAGTHAAPQVYIGQRTMRQVTREVALRMDAPMRDTLALLRLKGWHARSYRHYTSWAGENATPTPAASPFIGRIDISDGPDSRLSTRPPGHVSGGGTPGNPGTASWEPVDSTFLDVTILSHVNNPNMSDSFYVGVLNRRTNPMMRTGTETTPEFHPYHDLLMEWVTHPERLYDQVGAREVRIPFRYTLLPGKMLRITEMGAATTTTFVEGGTTHPNRPLQRPPLDTIIGPDRDFVTRFLPGEGRIYKVKIMDAAESTDSHGWLAHAGQRKIVFAPNFNGMADSTEVIAVVGGGTTTRTYRSPLFGTERRYHMVYHRRSGPDETGPLSVYYRRSTLMHNVGTAATADAVAEGDIDWEPEILLSNQVRLRQTPSETSPVLDTVQPSCGYPSIVVRYDAMEGINKVYVVYACEQGNPTNPQGQPIAICEAVLAADALAANQRTQYEAVYQTEILDYISVGPCGAGDLLRYWGTPTINASSAVNYYAWSDYQAGIEFGAKEPTARLFVNTQRTARRLVQGATVARHPSLNTYSRLHIGEPDASVVWQESLAEQDCEQGIWIAYTRLFYDPVLRTIRQSMSPDPTYGVIWNTPPELEYFPLADAVRLNVETGMFSNDRHPSVYRHLSDFGSVIAPSQWLFTGEMNHKAERVVWESTPREPSNDLSTIERRVFDVYDRWYLNPPQVTFWAMPQSRIFSTTHDLTSPSIAQGSQDRELYSNVSPARDWDYDDTTITLTFSAGANTDDPRMWLSAFGWDLYGQNTDWELTPSHMGSASHTIQLHNDGRRPHLAARYSMSQDRSTQKNRLIYEDVSGFDNPPGDYTPAPPITRTNEGLYRQALYKGDATEQTQRQSIEYAGFRSDRAEVFLSSIRLGERDIYFHAEEDYTVKKNTDQRLVTPWIPIEDMEYAALSVVSTGETERFDAVIERQSDGTRLPLNILATNLGRAPRRHGWKLGADPTERYRFVIESKDRRAAATVDIELVDHSSALLRSSTEHAITVLDLRTMRAISATDELRVFPQPAGERVTIVRGQRVEDGGRETENEEQRTESNTTRPTGYTISISTLAGECVLQQHIGTAPVVVIDVSGLVPGTYVVSCIGVNDVTRTMLRITR